MKKHLLVMVFLWPIFNLQAQEKTITGRVTDEFNTPIPGVNVVIQGTKRGIMTGFDGDYSLKRVTANDTLQFSFVGMKTQLIPVKNKNVVNVILQEDSAELDEMVITAFGGKQKKESVVASIETINPSELKIPSSNLSTALAGRISGLISYQRSGEPGADGADFFIRGVTSFGYAAGPLILIDGVESTTTELNAMQPDDIETFSIMKDAAATAVYGARGGNGVINVTTKKGKGGKLKVNIRHEQSLSMSTDQIDLADPITYMQLHNEATLARDPFANRFYSQRKIEQTANGANPYVYPATDWYDLLFKDEVLNTRTNFNLSGGSPKVTYYLAGTFNEDNGNLKVDNLNNFNNNINVKTFVLRSNVGLSLTKTTDATIRFTGQFKNYNGPLISGNETYRMVLRADPVAFAPFFEPEHSSSPRNHILFGNDPDEDYLNPYAEMVKGYKEAKYTTMKAQVKIEQDFNFITKGLNARFLFATDRYSSFDAQRQYNPYYYYTNPALYDPIEDTFSIIAKNPDRGTEFLSYSPSNKIINTSDYYELVLNYNRKFNNKHDVNSMLVATRRNYETPGSDLQSSLPHRNAGYAGRLSYGLSDKYFAEFNFGLNGSERFAKKNRWGFFPSAGLGYMLSNENFWDDSFISKVFTTMRFKATYGLSGTDAIGDQYDRFFYLSNINLIDSSRGYSWGEFGDVESAGVSTLRYANDEITWETSKKMNLGIETKILNQFELAVDYYTEERDNILQARTQIPVTMGLLQTPTANVGKAKGYGIDMSLDYNQSWTSGLWLSLRGNFTYAVSEYEYYEDVDRSETPWLIRTGQSTSQAWGHVAERLFIDQADVDNSPIQTFGDYGPGDIKYRDINGDGQITAFDDQVPIGNPQRPEIIYGFGFSAGYKGFDISAFFQGLGNESFFIDPSIIQPFVRNSGGKNALLQVIADNHWSESNPDPKAFWPSLTDTSLENNEITSTWWMRDGSFLRMKTLELGYNLPQDVCSNLNLGSFRLYASGINLLTFSKFKLWDPEMGGNGFQYPIQKVFNVGLRIGL